MKLYEHQKETVNFLKNHPRALVTSTCGTGKTISILETWHKHLNGHMLVIAPKSTLGPVWGNDCKNYYPQVSIGIFDRKFTKDPDYIYNLLWENKIVVINIEAVNLVLKHTPVLAEKFSTLVIDEFTSIKNRTAKRSKNVAKLVMFFKYRYFLSGTPTPNGIMDIWHPAYCCDDGIRLGSNFFYFRNSVCQPVSRGYHQQFTEWTEIPGAADVVASTLKDITIRHVLEDVVDMPKRIYRTLEVEMPDKLYKAYQELKQTAILELSTDNVVTAVNKAVLGNKLLQAACLTGDTEVYTQKGWVQLIHLKPNHQLWDGTTWVNYDSIIDNGYMDTIECWGVQMTLGHKILTNQGWKEAWEIKNGEPSNKFKRSNFRLPNCLKKSRFKTNRKKEKCTSIMGMSVYLWEQTNKIKSKYSKQKSNTQKLWLQSRRRNQNPWINLLPPIIWTMDKNKKSLWFFIRQRLQKLRSTRYNTLQKMAQFQTICSRYGTWFQTQFTNRSHQQQQRIFQNQLSMGHCPRAIKQHTCKCHYPNPARTNDSSASSKTIQNKTSNNIPKNKCQLDTRWKKHITKNKVYDILNAGNKHQFLIRNKQGEMFISHNSGSLYDTNGNSTTLDTNKYELITELVKERQHSLVFYQWNHQCEELERQLTKEKINYAVISGSVTQSNREQIIKDYQDGCYQTLLLQPAAAAHGITLTISEATIWCSPTWNLETFLQANYRDYRIGQEKRTEVIMIQYKDTIEEEVYKRLTEKKNALDNLLTILKS